MGSRFGLIHKQRGEHWCRQAVVPWSFGLSGGEGCFVFLSAAYIPTPFSDQAKYDSIAVTGVRPGDLSSTKVRRRHSRKNFQSGSLSYFQFANNRCVQIEINAHKIILQKLRNRYYSQCTREKRSDDSFGSLKT